MPSMINRHVIFKSRDHTVRVAAEELSNIADVELLILRSHLIIESVMFTAVSQRFTNRTPIIEAGLSFRQLFFLAQGLPQSPSEHWVWHFVTKLSRIRNDISHELKPRYGKRLNELVELSRKFLNFQLTDDPTLNLRKALIMTTLEIHNVLAAESPQDMAQRQNQFAAWQFITPEENSQLPN
ncbi:MAG: hypothetical protein AAF585_12535 [Verrucomicrobiota bacterium]